jgi:hypothetical protein
LKRLFYIPFQCRAGIVVNPEGLSENTKPMRHFAAAEFFRCFCGSIILCAGLGQIVAVYYCCVRSAGKGGKANVVIKAIFDNAAAYPAMPPVFVPPETTLPMTQIFDGACRIAKKSGIVFCFRQAQANNDMAVSIECARKGASSFPMGTHS